MDGQKNRSDEDDEDGVADVDGDRVGLPGLEPGPTQWLARLQPEGTHC